MQRKPGDFTVAGFDPELGRYAGDAPGTTSSMGNATAADSRGTGTPLWHATQEIDWLRQQGILSKADADQKKQILLEQAHASAGEAEEPARKTLRQRMFGAASKRTEGGAEDVGATANTPEPPTKRGMLTRDGKLYQFELAGGSFTCRTLEGEVKKEWITDGHKLECLEKATRSQPYAFHVIIGTVKIKLEAGSREDMRAWCDTFQALKLMGPS